MKVKYEDTDTLYVELADSEFAEIKELNQNVYLDRDAGGRVVSLTIEHAKVPSGKLDFCY